MNNEKIVPLILCGGKGNRLWPLSRPSFPKQFLSLGKNRGKTLLQNTIERISKLDNIENPILICNEENRFIVAEQLRDINVKPQAIILEPFGRGTAPAITIGALQVLKTQTNPFLLVLSSDHEVICNEEFIKSVEAGLIYAQKGNLVTFGVVPNSPSTAFGYIESKEPLSNNSYKGSKICSFIEKPNLNKAKILFKNKKFTWNSGIFLFKTKSIINELEVFEPKLLEDCREAINDNIVDLDFLRIKKDSFFNCKNVSFDVSIMEKTNSGIVIPLNAGWKDLGSWSEVWESSEKDINGNSINGNIILKNCVNSFIHSESRLVAGIGLRDLVIVETSDAILVLNKSNSQKVKELVEELNRNNKPEGSEHKKIFRPWGNYTTLVEDLNWKVKKIVVNPNQSLSLQMHKYRTEHWIVLKGEASVEINGKNSFLNENQSTYIPLNAKHRISNNTNKVLVIIEVQCGESVEENDIVRFEDKYGRLKI